MLHAFFWVIPRPENYPEESKQHVEFPSKNKFEKLVHLVLL